MTGIIAGDSNDNNHYQEHQECLEKRLTLRRNRVSITRRENDPTALIKVEQE